MNPNEWIIGRDTGTSSKTIWAVMMKAVNKDDAATENSSVFDIPHDTDDFGRCYRLLSLFPEWRKRLNEVSDVFPVWIPYIREWGKLEKLYNQHFIYEDCRFAGKGSEEYKQYSKTWDNFYNFIQELEHEGRLLGGWVCRGGSHSSYHKQDDKDCRAKEQLAYCKECKSKCKFEVKEK